MVPVYAGYTPAETRRALKRRRSPSYMGTFTSARRYVLQHLRQHRKRADEEAGDAVHGQQRLPALPWQAAEARGAVGQVRRARHHRDVAPAAEAGHRARSRPMPRARPRRRCQHDHPEQATVVAAHRRGPGRADRASSWSSASAISPLERSTPTLSPGELQRLRLATQVKSNLFGVVYVLDEPSAGLHPADTEALLRALDAAEGRGQFAVRGRA